jgi:hypothetical protein
MMVTKSKAYTASTAEEASADFEAHAAAAADKREEVKIVTRPHERGNHPCQLCEYVAGQANDLKKHVSTVAS